MAATIRSSVSTLGDTSPRSIREIDSDGRTS